MLVHLYAVHAWGQDSKADTEAPLTNGHARTDSRIRDAEDFELDGLVSDDEEDNAPLINKEGRSPASH